MSMSVSKASSAWIEDIQTYSGRQTAASCVLCAAYGGIKAFLTAIRWSCNASELAEVDKYARNERKRKLAERNAKAQAYRRQAVERYEATDGFDSARDA